MSKAGEQFSHHGRRDMELLRERAEKIVKKRFGDVETSTLSAEDARRLLQELQVHQIELEMQNEELRLSQQMLEESRQKFSDLYDFAPVGYLTLDKDGKVLEANLTGASLLGVDRARLIGKHLARHVARDSQDTFYKHRIEVLESDKQLTCVITLKRQDGVEFYAELESVAAKGKNIRVALIDVTVRKEAEEKVKRLASYPELTPNPVVEMDEFGVVHYLNPAAKALLNIDKPGSNPFLAGIQNLPELRAGKAEVVREVRINNAWYVQAIHRVPESDRIRVYARDITKSKEAEDELRKYRQNLEQMVEERTSKLLKLNRVLEKEIVNREKMEEEIRKTQKLESLGVLAGGIAHDFNNSLTAIMNNIAAAIMFLDDETKVEKVRATLNAAMRAIRKATAMTHQLLTFAVGGEPVKKVVFLKNLIKDTVDFSLRGSNVDCDFHVADDLWPVLADEGQISQVISNLVINAYQSMPGGGKIDVIAENIQLKKDASLPLKAGKFVKITVKDRGAGISKKDIPNIFDPFYTTKERGSGLGLTTAYSIVKKHEGHITVESSPEKGTSFMVYMPALKGGFRKEIEVGRREFRPGKILVMDDEEDVRDSVKMVFNNYGYEVHFTNDGEGAVKAYKAAMKSGDPYDVVVMDLTVKGGMGGERALGMIKDMDPNVRAVVASGYSNDPVMADHEKYGFIAALPKPYDVVDLSRIIQKIITARSG